MERASRPVPLFLTGLVAFFSALVALAVSNGHAAHAHGGPAAVTEKQVELRGDLRRLWEDHITWATPSSPSTGTRPARSCRRSSARTS